MSKNSILSVRIFSSLFVLILLFSCGKNDEEYYKDIDAELRVYVKGWLNTPYELGGDSKKGIDCSALTQNIYKKVFHVKLPRRVVEQRVEGQPVNRDSLLAGDLIVFRAKLFGRPHIGVYLSNNEFVHASTSQGVMISKLTDNYWKRRYKTARRVIDKKGHLIKNGVPVDD